MRKNASRFFIVTLLLTVGSAGLPKTLRPMPLSPNVDLKILQAAATPCPVPTTDPTNPKPPRVHEGLAI